MEISYRIPAIFHCAYPDIDLVLARDSSMATCAGSAPGGKRRHCKTFWQRSQHRGFKSPSSGQGDQRRYRTGVCWRPVQDERMLFGWQAPEFPPIVHLLRSRCFPATRRHMCHYVLPPEKCCKSPLVCHAICPYSWLESLRPNTSWPRSSRSGLWTNSTAEL